MNAGHFYRLAGLMGVLVLLSAADSEGQRHGGGGRPSGGGFTGPGRRPSSRPNPSRPMPKRPKYYGGKLPSAGLPKALASRIPSSPLSSYSYTRSLSRTAEWELVPLVVEG